MTASRGPTAQQVEEWSRLFRDWNYYPSLVISPQPDDSLGFQSTDCPLVFEHDGQWHMFYTGFNGQGYQTARAVSTDLIHWSEEGLVMGFGEAGAYDHGGVTFGGLLFSSYDLRAPRLLKTFEGKHWALYGCYPRQGGYELRPGAQGAAWSEDGWVWERLSRHTPILSVQGAQAWEQDCIYQPWLLEHDGVFYDFYNAAQGQYEQTGVAVSSDLRDWRRYPGNPVLRNGAADSFDAVFCSDSKVFWDQDHWVMLYFGVGGDHAHIMAAYSIDLLNWTRDPQPLYQAGGHPDGLDVRYAHKVSLVYDNKTDTFFMFYCAVDSDDNRGIGLLTSKPVV